MMNITKKEFGTLKSGSKIYQFILTNDAGTEVRIINYGGIITHLFTKDKCGNPGDIVLGFDNIEGYEGEHPYFGAIVGRFANRISKGKFEIDGHEYNLPVNNGPNSLHGGIEGFDKKVWAAHKEKRENEVSLKLGYESKDMEEGFPGNLMVEVEYILTNVNEFKICYKAKTDKSTHLNLTNHSYFNLNTVSKKIFDHKLKMDCPYYTPVNDVQIPTGDIVPVEGTPYDFTSLKPIGSDFNDLVNGYDHNFIINKNDDELKFFAYVEDPLSGRTLQVATTEPGVQLYTSNFLENVKGKHGVVYDLQDAFCLETQHYPDSPNQAHFPSTLLKPGEEYKQLTIFKFGTVE